MRRKAEQKSAVPEYEQRTFVNPSAVSPHLFCPICQEAFVNPQRAPCGHSFCKSCLDPWLVTNPVCPVDRKPIQKESLHHDFIIESIIGDYTVACPWRALGCDFVGPLHMLESHKKQCLMNPESMPPALRERTSALLHKWHQKGEVPNASGICITQGINNPTNSSSNSPVCTNSSAGSQPNVTAIGDVHATEDAEDTLPPTPPPSLLFRLYQNSDNSSRDLLCNFLETSSTFNVEPAPKRRRRGRNTISTR